ncbi:MAG: hypothetical protein LOY03_12410 [Cyclobacteriaceae bacterium]|jgi:hypothetical protein|nr:hypothetical protein [Cyclobacteriaceae bacterium]
MNAEEWITALYPEEIYRLPPTTLIVLPVPWDDLADTDRDMLRKLLHAVGAGMGRARIIHESLLTASMVKAIDPQYAIVFGVDVDPPVNDTEIVQIGRTSLIRTVAPDALVESLKRPLWAALQKMYSL